ncbi:hypothetical protein RUM44_000171 [Polyplax serrata]|uniref:Uncharacterized protein n=1 Tax=Polyplax serrata TaxID=468196 RepID=A0ABR1B4R0_POLSC
MMKGSSKHNRVDVFNSGGLSPGKNSIPRPGSSTPNSVDASVSTEDLEVSEPGSLGAASDINVEEAEPQSFLLGPMVVRVLPNGMPIPGESECPDRFYNNWKLVTPDDFVLRFTGEKNQLPKDEDIEELAPSRYHRFPTGSRPSPNGRLIQSSSSPRIGYDQYRYGKQGPARFYPQQPSSYDTYRMRPREYPATR